jgi:hypothetical protein
MFECILVITLIGLCFFKHVILCVLLRYEGFTVVFEISVVDVSGAKGVLIF